MRVLLDTHAFLWYMAGDDQLSDDAKRIIDDRTNERWLSIASLWEIALKMSKGRLSLGAPFEPLVSRLLSTNDLDLLGISIAHTAAAAALPYPESGHRDPFDRMLIAQCQTEDLVLVSKDALLEDYGVPCVC